MKSMSHPRRFTAFLIPLLALTACLLMPSAPAHAATCHYYAVNLQGTAAIGDSTAILSAQQFSVVEYAMWRDTGVQGHPVEFWLTPDQSLNASAQVGHIELMTNSFLAHNAGIASQQYNLAAVAVDNNGVASFQLDSGMSFVLPPPNVFVAPGYASVPGGLGGLCFLPGGGGGLCDLVSDPSVLSVSYLVPRTGGGYFYIPDSNSIAGMLDLVGTTPDNVNFQGRYQAWFGGTYIGSEQCD
jgi:hypothetical protein